jgi:hypothetical protein
MPDDWILSAPIDSLIRRKARALSHSPGFSRSDQPDIEQEFRLHLLGKAAKYDSVRSKRTTWAKRLIQNKAASIARKTDAKKCSYRRNSISLNELVADCDGSSTEMANLFDESAGRRHIGQRTRSDAELTRLRLDLAEANRNLPAPLKKLAALLSHVAEFPAGQVLGISRRQTRRQLEALRTLYEARGLAG